MSKRDEDARAKGVQQAIRSLYEMFPNISSCQRVQTIEARRLEKAIRVREEQLRDAIEKDKQIVKLKDELAKIRKAVKARCDEGQRLITQVGREFNLRGPTEKVIAMVDKIAAMEPVVFVDSDCE